MLMTAASNAAKHLYQLCHMRSVKFVVDVTKDTDYVEEHDDDGYVVVVVGSGMNCYCHC